MNHYETLFIFSAEVGETQRKEAIERTKRLVEGMGGSDFVVEEWGLRDLAFLSRKQARGFSVRLDYRCRPEVVKELERTMKLADDILRFVSVRLPKMVKPAAPAATQATTSVAAENAPSE
jgi:small subunit ribosomal protein S6